MYRIILFILLLAYSASSKEVEKNKLTEASIFLQDFSSERLESLPENFFQQLYIYDFEISIKDTNILNIIDNQNQHLKEIKKNGDMGVKIAIILKYSKGKSDTICISDWFEKGIYKNGKYYGFDPKLFEIIEMISPKSLNPEFEWTKFLRRKNLEKYFIKPKR